MKRKIKSVVAMLLAVAMTVALLPQTNFAVNAAAEDFPIERTGTARVTTNVSGAASNKKNYLTIELDEADETNVLFTLSGIYGADAGELMAGGVLGFQLDEDITGHFEYDADTDTLSAVVDQELYGVTGVGVYTAPYTVTVEPQITKNDDGSAEFLFDVIPQVEGEESPARRLYSTANANKKTGYVLDDFEVTAIIDQLQGGGGDTPTIDYDALNAELDVTGDLQYMSEPYMENGTYTAQGKIGFSNDGTAMVDLWLIFVATLEPVEKPVVKWSVENGELQFNPDGAHVSAWAPIAPDMGTLEFDVLMLTEKDAEGNTIVRFGWGTPEEANCPFVYKFTPADVAALEALQESGITKYNVTVDGETTAVKEGTEYTLPTTAKIGYYANGEVYKPGATVTVTEDLTFTSINEVSVSMATGAGIKASTPAGIRWQATVNSDNMDAVASETAIKAGMLISANDLVENAGTLDKNSTYATKDVANSGWYMNNAGTYCAAIVGINEENYTRDFVARAYVTVTYNDGTAETYYSEMGAVRSVETIAKAVVADNYRGLTDAEKTVVDSFIK